MYARLSKSTAVNPLVAAVAVSTKFTVLNRLNSVGNVKSVWLKSCTKMMSALTVAPDTVVPTACTVHPVGALAEPTGVPAPATMAQPM